MKLAEAVRRIWYLLRREQVTRELEEEIRIHIELRAEWMQTQERLQHSRHHQTTNALSVQNDAAYVMSNDTAHRAARKRFGNRTLIQERSKDMWGFGSAEELSRDFRFATRRLARRKTFALSVIAVMAVGIGAVTAMFSAVDAALIRPLPFLHPEQLVTLPPIRVPFDPGSNSRMSASRSFDFRDATAMRNVFSEVAAYAAGGLNLGDPDHPARLKAGVVTANFFRTLGINAFRGRTFAANEGNPGGPRVAILSHGLWQRQFGGRDITGLQIVLSAKTYDVIGVAPPGFGFPAESDLWIPMTVPTTPETFGAFRNFLPTTVIGRVVDSIAPRVASAQLLERLKQSRAAMNEPKHLNFDDTIDEATVKGAARPLQRELVGDRRSALMFLLAATGLLLLVACVNVTNLLLSQATLREREIAVRQVLGASRVRIVRQLLTESVVLSATGALIGIALAPVMLRVMRALLPTSLAGVASATIDLRVITFAALIALVTGLAFGLWPALGSTRRSHAETIKGGGGHGATTAGAKGARRALVLAELALTVMLLIGAGLMLRSFDKLLRLDSGMRVENVATLEMSIPRGAPGGRAEILRHMDAILGQLAATDGIVAAGVVNDLPLSGAGGIGLSIEVDGAPRVKGEEMTFARYLLASGGYFKAMGITLLAGRTFTAADDSLAPKVAIISSGMARKYWPDRDAVGRTFRLAGDSTGMTIVGVVSDVREGKLENDPGLQMYLPIHAQTPASLAIVARGSLAPRALLSHLQDAVRSVDKSQAVYNVRMMEDVLSKSVAPRRTNTILISLFAAVALALAVVGVYAVVAHNVSNRSRELGIRSALGATGSHLLRMISREMLWVSVAGVAIGVTGAWALAKTLESLVYEVDVHDPLTYVVVPLALLVPIAFATFIPARRAMRVNPADVMRAD